MSFLFSSKQNLRGKGDLPPLRRNPAPDQAANPVTLLHNLRTRPLTFVAACLGLFGVLAVKILFVRARETTAPTRIP